MSNRFVTRTANINTESLMKGYAHLPAALKRMGFAELREGQRDPINNIMGMRDTLCILPTGTGKTAVFTLPTLALGWRTLIFSPLQALMRDQCQSLNRMGVRAGQMNGLQTDAENQIAARLWMSGELQMFYVAPERLKNQVFQEAMRAVPPDMVVMDEAHTLSQWADTFRPSYMAVGDFIVQVDPKVVTAFTATAPEEVEKDIRKVLCMQNAARMIHYPVRSNLKLTSRDFVDVSGIAQDIQQINGPTIVYCSTRKGVETVAKHLSGMLPCQVAFFHGDLPDATKRTNQDMFMNDEALVMVATNAFGMGIDKSNIRGVIHHDFPGSPEALAQETGRAGRDRKESLCITYYSETALRTQNYFLEIGNPSRGDIEAVYAAIRRAQDSTGLTQVTGADLAKMAKIQDGSMRAIMSILIGNNVISRESGGEKIAKVRFIGSSESERFQMYKADMERGGQLDSEGFYSLDLDWLADSRGVGYSTVTGYMRNWDKEGLIRYVAPYRGSATRIIGSTNLIDFDRLAVKAEHSKMKLKAVLQYFHTPDPHKHEYLKGYCVSHC